jgi:hypothetical protein
MTNSNMQLQQQTTDMHTCIAQLCSTLCLDCLEHKLHNTSCCNQQVLAASALLSNFVTDAAGVKDCLSGHDEAWTADCIVASH